MKRVIFSLLAGMALMAAPVAKADNITFEQAKDAAVHYLQHTSELEDITTADLVLIHQNMNEKLGVPSMYFFNVGDCGWIIFGGSTVIDPVVGFSDEDTFDMDDMAPALRWWLDNCNEMFCDIQVRDAEENLPDSRRWIDLSTHSLKGNTKAGNVVLMSEKWDQGGHQGNDYNMYSPQVNGVYCPTGCVATAVAQICHYYRFPLKATGTKRYKWNNRNVTIIFDTAVPFDYSLMPNCLYSTNGALSATVEQRREVSRLARFVGQAVEMNYGAESSGAVSADVPGAMQTYFKYELGTLIKRDSTPTATYMGGIRSELLTGHPVYMSGASSNPSGVHDRHAFVCCGYQESDENMYWMNWGWGGKGNKYYNLYGNSMPITSMGYNFILEQAYIKGMRPPADSSWVGISEVDYASTLGMAYPNPATLSVTLPYSTKNAAELSIYNALGQLVKTFRVQAGEGELEVRVDAMPSGIYIYRLGNTYGKFVVR